MIDYWQNRIGKFSKIIWEISECANGVDHIIFIHHWPLEAMNVIYSQLSSIMYTWTALVEESCQKRSIYIGWIFAIWLLQLPCASWIISLTSAPPTMTTSCTSNIKLRIVIQRFQTEERANAKRTYPANYRSMNASEHLQVILCYYRCLMIVRDRDKPVSW